MTGIRVFQWRIAATACVLLLAVAIVRLLWYPGVYFSISGIAKLVVVMVAVNVIVGPGLSAFVYKPGKSGLVLDFGVLAAVELAALVLAMSAIYARQPFYTVYAVDRFEVVTRNEVDTARIGYPDLRIRPGFEPRLVYAQMPEGEALQLLIDETVFEGKKDIDRRPEFWKPYTAGIPVLKAAAKPLENLLNGDDGRAGHVQHWLLQQGGSLRDFLYLPLRGKHGDAAMILHAEIGYPVDIIDVDPW